MKHASNVEHNIKFYNQYSFNLAELIGVAVVNVNFIMNRIVFLIVYYSKICSHAVYMFTIAAQN